MLDIQKVNSSTEAALFNYTKWANSGFWSSFFQLDLNVHSLKSSKLPSASVLENMCRAMMVDISTVTSAQMNYRLSYMEAVLNTMRKKETSLLNRYFTLRRHGINVLFLCSISMALLMFAIGMRNDPLSIVISSMIAVFGIVSFSIGRNAFKKKYYEIQKIAGDPGEKSQYILWKQN